jgi:Na+/melibiose symporter-like transporter
VQFFALLGFIFIVLQYLQLIRGDSGLVSAVSMLPMAAAMLPTARLAPTLVARLGARTASTAGLALIAAALAVLAQLTGTSSYWLVAAGLIPLGADLGLAMTPATSGITSALPASRQGVGSAINDLSREVGGAVGIAQARWSPVLPGLPRFRGVRVTGAAHRPSSSRSKMVAVTLTATPPRTPRACR